jgi:ElaB/YqjD/DUF883 family membrane-anchored ribosome-binding protein
MESNRNLTKDTKESHPATGSAISSSGSPGSQSRSTVASATQQAKDTAQSTIDQTKQAVTDAYDKTSEVLGNAYDKTSEVLSNTYDKTVAYGRENPGTMTLIAFGAGIGIGLLLTAAFSGGRSRTSRIAEPVVGALSQIALEFLR